MQQVPVPPVQHDPRVPPALSDVILTGMGKDPSSRFQTAADFRAALGRVLEAPVAAPVYEQAPVYAQAPVPMKQGMAPRTVYMLAGSLATVAVLALLVTQAPKFFRTNAQQQEPVVVAQQLPPAQTPEQPVVATPELQQPQQQEPVVQQPAAPAGGGGGGARVSAPVTPSYQPPVLPAPAIQRPVDETVVSVPVPQRQAAPVVPAIDRAALDEQRRRVIQMAQRIVTAKAALQSLRESMAQQGLRPRAELQGSAQRMQFEMDQAEVSIKNDNVTETRQHLDYAERALESLEKALNL
jgi:hypothetical protein